MCQCLTHLKIKIVVYLKFNAKYTKTILVVPEEREVGLFHMKCREAFLTIG